MYACVYEIHIDERYGKTVKMRERQRDERTGKVEWIRRMSVEE